MKIIPLSEGAFTIDKSKLFIPFDLGKDELQNRTSGSLLVEVQPFAVRSAGDILLLDTGLGFERNGQLQVHQNLQNAGILPGQVTRVLVSHLHKDHAGGISRVNGISGLRELAFPNARYYIQKKELEFAFEKGFPSYITEELELLKNNEQVVLLQGNGTIDGMIQYEVTGAHCPYHQVFWIRDKAETIFFGADDAPQIQQMKNRIVAKYDFNGRKAMELRRQWWERGEKESWTFLFYHDIQTPVFLPRR
jgi:glyoxylase-like metal-dependent hydrolase (beta-lactamase superfamily II)